MIQSVEPTVVECFAREASLSTAGRIAEALSTRDECFEKLAADPELEPGTACALYQRCPNLG